MYDLPGRDDIERVMIDRDVVEKKVNPTLVPNHRIDEPTERSACVRERIGSSDPPILARASANEVYLSDVDPND
jgi:hypothetical protein